MSGQIYGERWTDLRDKWTDLRRKVDRFTKDKWTDLRLNSQVIVDILSGYKIKKST